MKKITLENLSEAMSLLKGKVYSNFIQITKITNDLTNVDDTMVLGAVKGKDLEHNVDLLNTALGLSRNYTKTYISTGMGATNGYCYIGYNFPYIYRDNPSVEVTDFSIPNTLDNTSGSCTVLDVTNKCVLFAFHKNEGEFIQDELYSSCQISFTVTSND
jgi:hypothetical protein